ncbi:hypothetical protein R3W88_011523 [Solanum pinnatisectum]|uniref:Uncharacterized protein n=1 Tax=Solanum pinnatisectum TaxID=50273 RepID=A0AAV9L8W3_9SOLN|nr:hypothetical protein R3W88_011523 [Solanum pinnatisectum]
METMAKAYTQTDFVRLMKNVQKVDVRVTKYLELDVYDNNKGKAYIVCLENKTCRRPKKYWDKSFSELSKTKGTNSYSTCGHHSHNRRSCRTTPRNALKLIPPLVKCSYLILVMSNK